MVTVPRTAKPSIAALLIRLESPFFSALKSSHRFDAIWTGQGGDHVMMALKTPLIVSDFVQTRGFRPGLLATLNDANQLTGHSIAHLVHDAVRFAIRSTRSRPPASQCPNVTLLASSRYSAELEAYIRHPWEQDLSCLPPGKRYQITLLTDVLHRHRPFSGTQAAVELHPLLSQPIVEHCLGIPTYELLRGGRTRALARSAFAMDLPKEILNREQKGQTTHHALGLIRRNLSFLSPFLLKGALMKNGLLNQHALSHLLTPGAPIVPRDLFALYACLAAEAWVRAWTTDTIHDTSPPAPTL